MEPSPWDAQTNARSLGSLQSLVDAYFVALDQDRLPTTVREFCDSVPVSRGTFYRHFESLKDLDSRWVGLFYRLRWPPPILPLQNFQVLESHYRRLIEITNIHRVLFLRFFRDDRLSRFR